MIKYKSGIDTRARDQGTNELFASRERKGFLQNALPTRIAQCNDKETDRAQCTDREGGGAECTSEDGGRTESTAKKEGSA